MDVSDRKNVRSGTMRIGLNEIGIILVVGMTVWRWMRSGRNSRKRK